MIRELVVVDHLHATSLQNKNHFKKSVFMLMRLVFVDFFEIQRKGLVQMTDFHACKYTNEDNYCTIKMVYIWGFLCHNQIKFYESNSLSHPENGYWGKYVRPRIGTPTKTKGVQ